MTARPLVLRPSRYGNVQIDAEVDDLPIARQMVTELREDLEGHGVEGGQLLWAGPYEVLTAVTALIGSATGIGALIIAALDRYVARHPEHPLVLNITVEQTIIIDGRPHTPQEIEAVGRFFSENAAPMDHGLHPPIDRY